MVITNVLYRSVDHAHPSHPRAYAGSPARGARADAEVGYRAFTSIGGAVAVAGVDVPRLLAEAEGVARHELGTRPRVQDKGAGFELSSVPRTARVWHRLPEAVAVAADLVGSTALAAEGRRADSTASVYEASTGVVVRLLYGFGADFIAVQGDGAFGLFWGDRRQQRAVCAAITIATFSSEVLVPSLRRKWPTLRTGLRTGIAQSPLLVKRVSIPGTSHHEPVWAGHAVNYATKAATAAPSGHIVITKCVWGWVEGYLAKPCPCRTGAVLWRPTTIAKIPGADKDGRRLTMGWCPKHRRDYCNRLMDDGPCRR